MILMAEKSDETKDAFSKSTKGQVESRVAEIADMICDGYSSGEICRTGSEKWNISTRQVERYMASANEVLSSEGSVQVDSARGKAIRRYEALYRKAMAANDHESARKVVGDMCKLLGLNLQQAKVQQNLIVNVDLPSLPSEEFAAEFLKRMARAEHYMKQIDAPPEEGEDDE